MGKTAHGLKEPLSWLGITKSCMNIDLETGSEKIGDDCGSNGTDDMMFRWLQAMIPGCTRQDAAYIARMAVHSWW